MGKTAITPTRTEDYPEWYQQVVSAAELAETTAVRGCMVIKPWGYAVWEAMQQDLDRRFKATGHVNAYFPLLIPLSHLEKEAEHVEGFAKECAVVTHHRLKADGAGGLTPDGKLEEPYVIRPTSETIIGATYAKWVQSHRDLPILINQWANVMRWEMRTRLFLRTSEFLWQEGHTAHATKAEAIAETSQMLDVYAEFAEDFLALPVIKGEKTANERFPGALSTFTIEAMMQDRKALQSGTSHFLGQNFAKAANIQFTNREGSVEYAWTTSWGVSTRLIGGLIMTHSDDDGLVLPPNVAPQHAVIIPIYRNDDERSAVMAYCESTAKALTEQHYNGNAVRVHIDNRDMRGGEKNWHWVKKGVPLRLEIGPRDIANDAMMVSRRDQMSQGKQAVARNELINTISVTLADIHHHLFQRAQAYLEQHSCELDNLEEFDAYFTPEKSNKPEIHAGFAYCHAIDDQRLDSYLKALKVTARCIPLDQEKTSGKCIFTGETVKQRIIFAKAY